MAGFLLTQGVAAIASDFYVVTPSPGKGTTLPPPEITVSLSASELPAANLWSPYAYNFAPHATVTGDPTFEPGTVIFSAQDVLPAGMTLHTDGTLSGTPTDSVGASPIKVLASYRGKTGEQLYVLLIGESQVVVQLADATLPKARVGRAYSFDFTSLLTVENDNGPASSKVWALSGVPSGLSYANGFMTGTPSVATDAAGAKVRLSVSYKGAVGTKDYQLIVAGGAPLQVTHVAAREAYSCAITTAGAMMCWGQNYLGRFGNGSFSGHHPLPVQVSGMGSGVTAIALGDSNACAVQSGALKCWGDNTFGQVGDGTNAIRYEPTQVYGLTSGVSAVTIGREHICAVQSGVAKCWGSNGAGRLGDGSGANQSRPSTVSGLTSGVTAIAAGFAHTCAVRSGAVRCWGFNPDGRLGDNSTLSRATPVAPTTVTSNVTALAASEAGMCALRLGSVFCWGNNGYGQVGKVGASEYRVPTQVAGLTSVSAIGAGQYHNCAVQAGALLCWGSNDQGQLGADSPYKFDVPTAVSGLTTSVTAVAGGSSHTCVNHGGVAKCFGENSLGQLGDDSNEPRSTPGPVLAD